MGANQTVFRAQRWRVLLWFVGCVAFGLWFATAAHGLAFLPDSSFHGRAAILRLVPAQGRFGLFVAISAFFCFAGVMLAKFLIDPRTAVVGDEGIEVFSVWGSRQGLWADFAGIKVRQIRRRPYVSLLFVRPNGKERTVSLNFQIMGVPAQAVLDEASARMSGPSKRDSAASAARRLAPPATAAGPAGARAGGPAVGAPRKVFGRR